MQTQAKFNGEVLLNELETKSPCLQVIWYVSIFDSPMHSPLHFFLWIFMFGFSISYLHFLEQKLAIKF